MTAPAKKATNGKKTKRAPYWWFQGASVRQLYEQLETYGPDTSRLEVYLSGKMMTFKVVAADGRTLPVTNDSHICPPQCP